MEGITEQATIILIIVGLVAAIHLVLLLSVIKLIKNTNKDVITKLNIKSEVKSIKTETNLELKVVNNKKK